MSVDQGYAAWLKTDALYVSASDQATVARWAAAGIGISSEVVSPLALKADADAEAARQAAILGGPLAIDTIVVAGLQRNIRGVCIRIMGDRLGYETGASVFVIGTQESDSADITTLTVLRRVGSSNIPGAKFDSTQVTFDSTQYSFDRTVA